MPPKKGGKKGKRGDDDAEWEKFEKDIPGLDSLKSGNLELKSDQSRVTSHSGAIHDELDDEDAGGGLLGMIQANSNKKNKKKQKTPALIEEELPQNTVSESGIKPIETQPVTDDEWALPVKPKGKPQKKKENNQVADQPPKEGPLGGGDAGSDHDVPASRTLSKKEKEKLKKEREKAKKKAEAAEVNIAAAAVDEPVSSVLAQTASQSPSPAVTPAPTSVGANKGDADGASGKKKLAANKEAPKSSKSSKKKTVGLAALKAAMEAQKAAEEEARRKEEEERRRIEEEERRIAEEERLKEEAKQLKKEREKAKIELAKKEGRYLTDKQKKERARAEAQKKALLASGVRIQGLEEGASAPGKRVVYETRKRKPPPSKTEPSAQQPDMNASTSNPGKTSGLEEPAKPVPAPPVEDQVLDPDVKDEWDASSDESEPEAPSIDSEKIIPKTNIPTSTQIASAQRETSTKDTVGKDNDKSSNNEESASDSDETSSDSSSEEELTVAQKQALVRKAEAAERRQKRHEEALAARSKDNLRSPICCILGHVDTGKTKLLDKIRQTNVQEGEAGGITQQIGATYFPVDAIKEKTKVVNAAGDFDYNIPGLLVIDTPGHESFTNLRSRGSSLCNIAVLVVDIMHGLEPQTLESLRLLRDRKTPFVVALNKIDRMYGWVSTPDNSFRASLANQPPSVKREFDNRCQQTILAFAEQGLNAALYYENKNMGKVVSLVPTSAITGEGVPDLIMLLVNLTQTRMSDRLMYLSELECTVLEVKVIEGLGTTIDVVLSNGVLREGDKIVLCGLNGPIVTQIRALLTPQPMRELRIKSAYVHHKEVRAALGVKIAAPDLEKSIAGSRLMVVGPDDDEVDLREEVMSDLTSLLESVERSGRGVTVQASTLGSLEALLDFLKVSKIPVAGIGLGTVHKRDIMQAAIMLERAKELACILAFDVAVDKDAERIAEELGIKIFKADIIYHLFDAFTAYNAEIMEAKRRDAAPQAIWPCRLKTIAVFAKRDPIILGVDILDGSLRIGTPLCVVKTDSTTGKKEIISLGKITSLEINHKSMEVVKKSQAGAGVAVKIEHAVYQSAKMYGRHFDDKDELLSQITRQSIDVMKESFKAELSKEELFLIKGLKQRLDIP
ncbi:uncharacterized protein EI90DRAFT_3049253 [Cantharellus anzutake]|uniref:uncharacterized protein n=1 Tax=Cantharellus anzutake TaxID=1750568 RepID=UPI001905444B|nr:uncharacterized protein EI90DRAFT_3049253 [Cantharellus anzutake]KAF8335036.1 hypothetical protein EI90DRAFT_3049253 [Cantharellus anzutake]